MNEFPKVPAGQPTWARVRHGGGCALPRRREKDGSRPVVGTTVKVRLVFVGVVDGCEVWRVPAGAWSPGDVVEIGPLPAGVRVEYDLARPYVAPFPAVAADDVEVVSA